MNSNKFWADSVGKYPVRVTYKDTYGCSSFDEDTVVVNPKPFPNLPDTVFANYYRDSVNLDGGDYKTWNWVINSSKYQYNRFFKEKANYFSKTKNNIYLTVTDLNSCTAKDTSVVIIDYSVGLTHLNDSDIDIRVYPNPAKDKINLKLSSTLNNAVLTINDISGSTIYKRENLKSDLIIINVKYFAKGIYFIKIKTGKNTIDKEFVVE
jgi:hypothetical protein